MAHKITLMIHDPQFIPGSINHDLLKDALFGGQKLEVDTKLVFHLEEITEFKPLTPPTNRIEVYTDGGSTKTSVGNIGAYAAVILYPSGDEKRLVESSQDTTNNRMELQAVIAALSEIEIGQPITIFLDSEYVLKGSTVWGRKWRLNGWKSYNGGAVANRDLWEPLLTLVDMHKVTFQHVKGHSGNPGNELADSLCTAAQKDLMDELTKEASAFGKAFVNASVI
jgi:ribonuclease HI